MEYNWENINTAPKDGSYIWLSGDFCMRIGFWMEGKEYECHGTVGGGWRDAAKAEGRGVNDLAFAATRWMPTPKHPKHLGAGLSTSDVRWEFRRE